MPADLAIVVLAAGKGTRMKSQRAKVLHEAGGLPLVLHVLRAVQPLAKRGRRNTWVVIGHQAETVRGLVEPLGGRTVLQRPQLGTGHAVAQALRALPRAVKRLLVLPGDAPLVTADTLRALLRVHEETASAATILSADLDDPTGYGRIVRAGSGEVEAIVEQSALGPEHRRLREINSGMYCFERAPLASVLGRLGRRNIHREYYLTDAIALLRQGGARVSAHIAPNAEEILGVNTPAELAHADAVLHRRKAEALMAAGVTLYRPDTMAIDPDVAIGPDTIIERGVELRGATRIGARCRIGPFCILRNAVLADDVTVRPHSLVADTRLGADVMVGPFAHLRDGAVIRPGARIGNYVEVKKSIVGERTKAQHLTYLGDATIGRDTNIGAGTITCNYDGVHKNPTRIGDNVFVGSGTELVAPVRVGSGAYVAAGSTVTENVPADALAIARSRQVNKPGWARTRRQKLAAAKARKEEPAVAVQLANATAAKPKRRPRKPRRARRRARRR
ncbi:MAG TPA: bifunctional UDP-N-acetylglucosamine diphosphorylase/glucosamine-1-phosphate N-acetyltransferase GlmU [Candidatus Xenobia bacterium]|nr:bifunctional UDP-N-acetylglucosamine diphosphorylase/glucosamine-1-phosphate N-acetyltransferase GlmU [Candidatus Xenobia bacterium]